MKIKKAKKGLSKLTTKELELELLAAPPLNEVKAILQEADKRKALYLFTMVSENPQYIGNLEILRTLIKSVDNGIRENPESNEPEKIFNNLVSLYPPEYIEPISKEINVVCSGNPRLSAMAILGKSTPTDVIYKLVDDYSLNIPSQAMYKGDIPQNPEMAKNTMVLNQIAQILSNENGYWGNKDSGIIMTSRLIQKQDDSFIHEMASQDLNPAMAAGLLNAGITTRNPNLLQALRTNRNPEVGLALIFEGDSVDGHNVFTREDIFTTLIQLTENYNQDAEWIWDAIKNKIITGRWSPATILANYYKGKNLLGLLFLSDDEIAKDIIETFPKLNIDNGIFHELPIIEDIIHYGLNNPSLKDIILEQLSKEFLNKVRMTPQDREIVEKHFKDPEGQPPTPAPEMIEELFGENMNWYKVANIYKEADWKANAILTAIALFLVGYPIKNIIEKTKITEEELRNALQNEQYVADAKKIVKNNTKETTKEFSNVAMPSQSDVVNLLILNEGYREEMYYDTKGNPTIGIGFNLNRKDAREAIAGVGSNYDRILQKQEKLNRSQILNLLNKDLQTAIKDAGSFANNFNELPTKVKLILIDMAFNLGHSRLSEFKKMKNALEKNDFQKASEEMKNSQWYTQVKDRGVRLVNMMKSV